MMDGKILGYTVILLYYGLGGGGWAAGGRSAGINVISRCYSTKEKGERTKRKIIS